MYTYADCPACSSENKHFIIKEDPNALARCVNCGTVHPITIENPGSITVRVVVSLGNISFRREIELISGDIVAVGDEYIVEDEEDVNSIEVTSVELKNGKRVDNARAEDIETIWSRLIDYLLINVSLHHKRKTESIKIKAPGDHVFTVGEREDIGSIGFYITAIKTRDGRTLKRAGDFVPAKGVKRIYAKKSTWG
ncbi:MAG: HVO_0476 family zinc finger protein [Halobacteriota archaeon]|nr:HVO_0476 family zinc finger protein [Halobacteriota archaeon]